MEIIATHELIIQAGDVINEVDDNIIKTNNKSTIEVNYIPSNPIIQAEFNKVKDLANPIMIHNVET